MKREEIEEKYKWDLTTVFATDESWEIEFDDLSNVLNKDFASSNLTENASELLQITEQYLAISQRMEKLYVYASMKNDEDTRIAKYQGFQSKITALYAKFQEKFAFYEPEILMISDEKFAQFLSEKSELAHYQHFFERLFSKKVHVLSQKEEELLARSSEIFGSAAETFEIFDNADLQFPKIKDENGQEIQLTHGNFISFMESKNIDVRKSAYQAMYSAYEQFQHTYAKTLQTTVKVHNFEAKTRNYQSAREKALSEHFLPEEIYDQLLEIVHKNLPLLHRYLKLRQEILGLDELKMHDVYVPLSDFDYKFDYEAAKEKAKEILSVLGDDYAKKVEIALEERWIDVHENSGKRSGAYSGGSYDTNAFMLLNWSETLDDFFTLVHEMGHSMHSTYTRENQPYVYGDYPIFLAEIASTTNENILTESLLKEADNDQMKFALLNHWLDGFRGTVFRQTQFAEFEQKIHQADDEGQVLTGEFMNNLYAELNEKYYNLSASENLEIQYEWARIPHFYYDYYVFQYATGFAAASSLAEKIMHGTVKDKENYLNYLSAGNSDYPLEIMKKAGIDMTKADYLNDAFDLFEKRLSELENLIKKGVHRG